VEICPVRTALVGPEDEDAWCFRPISSEVGSQLLGSTVGVVSRGDSRGGGFEREGLLGHRPPRELCSLSDCSLLRCADAAGVEPVKRSPENPSKAQVHHKLESRFKNLWLARGRIEMPYICRLRPASFHQPTNATVDPDSTHDGHQTYMLSKEAFA
jgi:hypothetical protein